MFDRSRKKSVCLGILTLLVLTLFLLAFLRHLDQDIFEILARTKLSFLLMLGAFGCLCDLMDAFVYRAAFREAGGSFSLWDGIALTNLRTFGKAAVLTGGPLPLQSFYLYKKGSMLGRSVGITTVLYLIQKVSILVYTAVLIGFHWRWVRTACSSTAGVLVFSCGICCLIILLLLLLCTSRRICHVTFHLLDRLPDRGKWPERKEKWHAQIEALYREAQSLLKTRKKFFRILLLNFCKLFLLYCIPYLVIRRMGASPYTLFQAQTLTSLMLLFSHAIPNIAGMGSVEFAFMLVFSETLEPYTAPAMVYYRCATYYFPFLVSILVVFLIEKISLRSQARTAEPPSTGSSR